MTITSPSGVINGTGPSYSTSYNYYYVPQPELNQFDALVWALEDSQYWRAALVKDETLMLWKLNPETKQANWYSFDADDLRVVAFVACWPHQL